jgi:hypothetical protein
MEELFIGTKIVAAEPMDEGRWALIKGYVPESLPEGSVVTSSGFRDGYKVRYEDGYISWSPKEIFERAHRKMTPKEVKMVLVRWLGVA